MSFEAYKNQALSMLAKQEFAQALSIFDKALESQPANPEIWYHKAFCYKALKEFNKASQALKRVLEIHPDLDIGWNALGLVHYETQNYPLALLCFEKAIELRRSNIEAWANKAKVLLDQKKYLLALEAINYAYSLNPQYQVLLGTLIFTKLTLCEWSNFSALEGDLMKRLEHGEIHTSPFELLPMHSSCQLQKKAAIAWAKNNFSHIARQKIEFFQKNKIRIGYFSSDLRTHPVGMIIDALLPHHDRSRYEIYGFFLNQASEDEIEKSIKSNLDNFFHLAELNDDEVNQLILRQYLDIAIDLNGYTNGGRMSIFARGAAKIQINFLGYPATCGTNFHDYIIADKFVIPEKDRGHYCEKVAYMPDCFFPSIPASNEILSLPEPTRQSQGLPENSFIYACFNSAYKIHPSIFSIWMQILGSVANSILWLSIESEIARANILQEAKLYGIDCSRIIFAKRENSRLSHLNRLKLINLFLDTPTYNAHTTAADVLSAGVPLLTIAGDTFASRVAASQLNTLGLPNLISTSLEEYKERAIQLATDPAILDELNTTIQTNLNRSPLFDAKQYMKNIEKTFEILLQ